MWGWGVVRLHLISFLSRSASLTCVLSEALVRVTPTTSVARSYMTIVKKMTTMNTAAVPPWTVLRTYTTLSLLRPRKPGWPIHKKSAGAKYVTAHSEKSKTLQEILRFIDRARSPSLQSIEEFCACNSTLQTPVHQHAKRNTSFFSLSHIFLSRELLNSLNIHSKCKLCVWYSVLSITLTICHRLKEFHLQIQNRRAKFKRITHFIKFFVNKTDYVSPTNLPCRYEGV